NVQLAAVPLHDMLDDRQAEPRAAGLARAAAVGAVEPLGEARQVLACDARAGVGDGDLSRAVAEHVPRHVDAASLGRIAHRIRHEVADRALQLLLRTGDLDARRAGELQRVTAGRQSAAFGL